MTRVNRASAFIVCGGLAEAVRRESASAVCYWWGVTAQTVTQWRNLLGVPTYNEGTKRLWRDLSAEFLTPEVQERARNIANSPASNAKKAAAKRGRPASTRQAVALAKGRQKLPAKAGKKRRGLAPDWDRRLLVVLLRSQGLSMSQIGKKQGWTKQYVHSLLRYAQKAGIPMPISCSSCQRVITHRHDYHVRDLPVVCLRCLHKKPEASFGERLRAYRVAVELTQTALANAARLRPTQITEYERDVRQPGWRNIARLVKVLGVDLIIKPEPRACLKRARLPG